LQIQTKIASCHTADSKPIKQEVNSTVILPPLVFPAYTMLTLALGLCNNTLKQSYLLYIAQGARASAASATIIGK